MEFIWLMVIIFLSIIECLTINLTTIWFVLSGLIALISSFFTDVILIQFGLFSILGTLFLIATKPFLIKKMKVESVRTNIDRVIGMEGIVTEKIEPTVSGEVKVDGKRWTAISNSLIEVGTVVKVNSISGVKLEVSMEER